jgi:hypothetical protein
MKGNPNLVNVLSGKLDFLKMVKGEHDSTYVKLKGRFDRLDKSNNAITAIIDLWENAGIDVAMKKFYSTVDSGLIAENEASNAEDKLKFKSANSSLLNLFDFGFNNPGDDIQDITELF